MRVRATAEGYFGLKRRHVGDEFDIESEDQLGSWMEPATGDAPVIEPEAPREPVALSEAETLDEPTPKKRGRPRKTD